MSKDIFARVSVVGHGKQRNHDDDDAGSGPVYADLVDEVQVSRSKRINQSAHQHHGPKAQDGLPRICHKVLVEDADGAQNKLRAREVDAQRNRPVAHESEPSVYEADQRRPLAGAQHGRPVVDAACSWEDGADFGERGGDADGDERDEDPAPEDGDGLAVGERDVQRGAEAEGHGHDGEGEAQDGHHGEMARQFGLVAQRRERLVGVLGAAANGGAAATSVHGCAKLKSRFAMSSCVAERLKSRAWCHHPSSKFAKELQSGVRQAVKGGIWKRIKV